MLNLAKDIHPVSYMKTHADEMLAELASSKSPMVITQDGEAKAVLLDVETYQGLVDSIGLMKCIMVGENDIREGRAIEARGDQEAHLQGPWLSIRWQRFSGRRTRGTTSSTSSPKRRKDSGAPWRRRLPRGSSTSSRMKLST